MKVAFCFSGQIRYIDEYVGELLRTNLDSETQNYNFITSEAINDLHFRTMGIDLNTFVPIRMRKMIHRGTYIQN
jgi:hypothetical protein